MTTHSANASVLKQAIVTCPPERAFEIFTRDFGRWWPLDSHHIGSEPATDAIIEPFAGGRWFERSASGRECDWGRVAVWEPPHRLVLIWQLNADFDFDSRLHTEVEVRFTLLESNRTRVELEHRGLEAYGDRRDALVRSLRSNNGWAGMLAHFAREVRPLEVVSTGRG